MNMFDAQVDAVFSAMKKVGYDDVDIGVGETGCFSVGDPNQPGVSKENAASFNGNLIKHVNSNKGTPLMPNKTFEVYVFALFNENLKPSVSEQNYGSFKPDFTPVYDVGVLKKGNEQLLLAQLHPVGLLFQVTFLNMKNVEMHTCNRSWSRLITKESDKPQIAFCATLHMRSAVTSRGYMHVDRGR